MRYDYYYDLKHMKIIRIKKTRECKKCGYAWRPRKQEPKECPACKSRGWSK